MENMHAIQRHILKNLTVKGRLRYRDLKPQSVEGNQLITHMLTHIFEGSDIKAAEKKVSEQYAWMNLAKVKAGELFPGFKEILKAIEKSKNSPFFEEFIVHI